MASAKEINSYLNVVREESRKEKEVRDAKRIKQTKGS